MTGVTINAEGKLPLLFANHLFEPLDDFAETDGFERTNFNPEMESSPIKKNPFVIKICINERPTVAHSDEINCARIRRVRVGRAQGKN